MYIALQEGIAGCPLQALDKHVDPNPFCPHPNPPPPVHTTSLLDVPFPCIVPHPISENGRFFATALWAQKRGRKTDAQQLGVSFAATFLRPQSGLLFCATAWTVVPKNVDAACCSGALFAAHNRSAIVQTVGTAVCGLVGRAGLGLVWLDWVGSVWLGWVCFGCWFAGLGLVELGLVGFGLVWFGLFGFVRVCFGLFRFGWVWVWVWVGFVSVWLVLVWLCWVGFI